jgi:hypothetical protein
VPLLVLLRIQARTTEQPTLPLSQSLQHCAGCHDEQCETAHLLHHWPPGVDSSKQSRIHPGTPHTQLLGRRGRRRGCRSWGQVRWPCRREQQQQRLRQVQEVEKGVACSCWQCWRIAATFCHKQWLAQFGEGCWCSSCFCHSLSCSPSLPPPLPLLTWPPPAPASDGCCHFHCYILGTPRPAGDRHEMWPTHPPPRDQSQGAT